jgi:23S rRNA-/tRNA-specific pseudouridylate synthase
MIVILDCNSLLSLAVHTSGIVGDTLYGQSASSAVTTTTTTNNNNNNNSNNEKLYLHAHKLMFPHPDTGEAATFTSDAPW